MSPGLLGIDLLHPMGIDLKGSTNSFSVQSAGIYDREVDSGPSGHPRL